MVCLIDWPGSLQRPFAPVNNELLHSAGIYLLQLILASSGGVHKINSPETNVRMCEHNRCECDAE